VNGSEGFRKLQDERSRQKAPEVYSIAIRKI
jgi:hypothetical protein